ncbi:cytochrome P450 [Leucogyrophana mollusca]|uniref:Cytochrome P450 n=1 Tax=Leucogyrophana mollusca TaxID=85980 RepID=A0ACB8B3U3_9AGAM|nr:cytochrome P450 [Leucogyrophana mollusca]
MIPTLDMHSTLILSLSVIAVVIVDRLARKKRASGGLPLPPGPTGLPLVGSLFSLDKRDVFYTYRDWTATYGDMVYARFLNEEMIIINSEKIAVDLLDKRSNNYSDRPFLAALKPYGWGFSFADVNYGDYWRIRRKLFHHTFRADAVAKFQPMQISKVHQLLANILECPEDYAAHLETYNSCITMSIVYGYDAKPRDDPLVDITSKAMHGPLKVFTPEGCPLVNAFPFLLRLPTWFPGATLARHARASHDNIQSMGVAAIPYMEKKMINGTAVPSLVTDMLERLEEVEADKKAAFEAAVKDVMTTTVAGASETTTATLLVFILAMVLHPEIQQRAQVHLDAVVGRDRLPEFSDRELLPYVEAILIECMRWEPVSPIGRPHTATESDVYEGYYIPKGVTIVANAWAMSRNESAFPNASEFKPERWLDAEGRLTVDGPPGFVFGFGRRVCPGRWAADAGIWIALCSLLANFEFHKAKDAKGREIDFVPTFTTGFVRMPDPFPSRVVARPGFDSERLAQWVRAST